MIWGVVSSVMSASHTIWWGPSVHSLSVASLTITTMSRRPPPGARGLGEAVVDRHAAAGAEPVQHAVDHASALLVLVEPEGLEVVQVPTRLGERVRERVVDRARERVGVAEVVGSRVAQEGDEVTRRGQPDSGDHRILRGVRQLVDRA